MKEKLHRFKIAFGYSRNGKLRTKILTVKAKDYSDAQKKVEDEYGKILISSFERMKE